jgi:hypothetical protein
MAVSFPFWPLLSSTSASHCAGAKIVYQMPVEREMYK